MGPRGNKILEDIHPLTIIKEVQKWPLLYSRDSRERGSWHFKAKVWHEVAKALFADWDSFTDAEKDCKVTDLTKRWRNLRDTFKRQVEIEKKIREGHEAKRKTYVYFKHMLFLLPHLSPTEGDISDADCVAPKLDEYFVKRDRSKKSTSTTKKRSHKRKLSIEQHFIETPRTSDTLSYNNEEIDEDKHFLMSLIPTFKRMSDDEKLTAKMEILKVLREIRKPSATEFTPLPDSLTIEDPESSQAVKVEMFQLEVDAESQSDKSEDSEQDSD